MSQTESIQAGRIMGKYSTEVHSRVSEDRFISWCVVVDGSNMIISEQM
jgi:hypothetical protein